MGFNIWGDKDWYLNAGRSLLSGDFSIEFILFSPFHSLLLAINDWFAEAVGIDSSLTAFLTRAPFCIFFGYIIYQFTRCLISLSLISAREANILALIILTSPYVIRYSSGIYPEYYSMLGGVFIVGRLLSDSFSSAQHDCISLIASTRRGTAYFFDFFESVLGLSEFRFALLIISICFFRYSFVAFAIPYIVLINFRGRNYVSSTFIARLQSLCRNFFCSFFSVVDAVKSTSFCPVQGRLGGFT